MALWCRSEGSAFSACGAFAAGNCRTVHCNPRLVLHGLSSIDQARARSEFAVLTRTGRCHIRLFLPVQLRRVSALGTSYEWIQPGRADCFARDIRRADRGRNSHNRYQPVLHAGCDSAYTGPAPPGNASAAATADCVSDNRSLDGDGSNRVDQCTADASKYRSYYADEPMRWA